MALLPSPTNTLWLERMVEGRADEVAARSKLEQGPSLAAVAPRLAAESD